MLESVFDRRIRHETGYDLYLEIPEKEYLQIYEEINNEAASDILQQFLQLHQDEGRPDYVEINYDKNNHTINIKALLRYEGNDHTAERILPNHLRHYESKKEY
ncbi:hypothetical protein SAMN05660297_02351 [Natronincola peptidivorans]|uniref:Uncharacterized protein n=1 Tax=Natronincola peptidivorans TaxID=426128 RepID=A0A1I0EB76_9FIRM|nr:hypothetical protein [Natronincola peptidivorans]SET42009.1 hypothetical protein SAMN05660297_02351 [Natronincola peptidivorans]